MNLLHAYGGIDRYCLGKRYYSTRGKARAACTAMERARKQKFKPYRCPNCRGFHITHKKGEHDDNRAN